ncbi:HIT domain-containing protein [Bacillus sp. H-16]|uniref:HIT family protein n=1 Tax=Alteribacter salitolerans TaxID=2912333 RepID=UPI001962DB25|nr:HIT domain-containing protein [Alteribacter salitolerans]MBM7095109.1 HIT domain-containing protein [Alteribacter salitolerans]
MGKKECVFCEPGLLANQRILFSNEHCLFLQLEEAGEKGSQLEGAGLIVPREHRETVFDLTPAEWRATYTLLHEVKSYIDEKHQPQGYNLGWNCGETGGQHIFHAHFHVLPRYDDELMAGKGIRYLFKSDGNRRGGQGHVPGTPRTLSDS